MIKLRTLGVLDVRDRDGAVLGGLLSQPKRLALLVYLAVAKPRGFHRRDRLVGLFWPELDDERARAALRGSLHFLRASLGADVVISRGDEIGLDPALIDADVDTLDAALQDGRLSDAVAEYAGAFLDGLHIKGAAELDQWMDSTRDALRNRVAAACWTLAEHASRVSGTDAAMWSARAVALTPYDEGAVRRRMQMLHDAGDNAAALRAYTEFSDWLRQEFDAAPSVVTRAVADACRAAPQSPSMAQGARTIIPALAIDRAPVANPRDDTSVAPHPAPRRQMRAIAATIAVMVVAALTIVYRSSAAPVSAAAANRFVVIPFVVEGAGEFGYLREGMVDLLSGTLDGSGALHAVDPHAVLSYAAAHDGDDPATLGKRTAQKFAAAYIVSGRVLQSGGRINVTAALSDATGHVITSTQASGDESMLFAMVDSLTRQLLIRHFGDPGTRLMRLAFSTTSSLPALKAYISGMQESRAGRFAEAATAFATAVQIDSTFALALYEQSVAIAWSTGGQDREAVISAQKAVAKSTLLPLHDRELLLAHVDNWTSRAQPAEARLLKILDDYPSDVDAWHELGEVRFHTAAQLGRSFVDAKSAFERVLDAPSLAPSARVHLTRIAAFEGDTIATARFARIEEHSPVTDARAEEIRLLDAAARSDEAATRPILASLAGADAGHIWLAAWSIAQYAGNWRLAERVALLLTGPDRSRDARMSGWLAVAQFRHAAGRSEATDAAIRELDAVSHAHAVVLNAGFTALPRDGGTDAAQLAAAASALRSVTPGSADNLTTLRGTAGDWERARIYLLKRIERPRPTPNASGFDGPTQPIFPAEAATRMELGLLAASRQQWREADHWFSLVVQPDEFDVGLVAAATRARAMTALRTGDAATAARMRARLAWLERESSP